jgi:hypothetical protein
MRDVIVERRGVEMLRGGQLFHLLAPLHEQGVTFLPDEGGQFIEIIDDIQDGKGTEFSRRRRNFYSTLTRSAVLFRQGRLRRRQTRNRDTERTATDVI